MTGFNQSIKPMTLGNMRENGVRSLSIMCSVCHREAVMSADPWPDNVPVSAFGRRMVCTRCGMIGADARPNWKEQPQRPSLTGAASPYHGHGRGKRQRRGWTTAVTGGEIG